MEAHRRALEGIELPILLDLARLLRRWIGYDEPSWAQMAPLTGAPEEGWARWEEQVHLVLFGLEVAEEPVMVEGLAAQTGWPEHSVRRALSRWSRFLRRGRQDGVEAWRILHRSFADFLAGKIKLRPQDEAKPAA